MDTDTADLIFAIMGNTEKGQLVSVLVPFLSAFFGALSAYYFQVNKEKKSEVRKQKLDLMHFFRINTVILSSLIEFKSNFLEHNEELFDELTIFCNSEIRQ